jgi:hypothetical protein
MRDQRDLPQDVVLRAQIATANSSLPSNRSHLPKHTRPSSGQ